MKKKKMILCGVIGGRTFTKHVLPIHFSKSVDGYGISEDAFQKIMGCKIDRIIMDEVETKIKWSSRVQDWIDHSTIEDCESGKRRFLPLKYMKEQSRLP